MPTREELIAQIEEKHRRQELMDQIEAKHAKMEEPVKDESGEARMAGLETGATMGMSPAIAGLGAAAGNAYSNLAEQGKGLGETWENSKKAFHEARNEKIKRNEELENKYPTESLTGNLGGSLLTAPFLPLAKGVGAAAQIGNAAKISALGGVGSAIGNSHDAEDAAARIGGGTALGTAVGAIPVVGGVASKALGRTELGQKAAQLGGRVGEGLKSAKDKIGEFLGKKGVDFAETATGLPAQDISIYSQKTPEINKIIKEHGNYIPGAIDQAREEIKSGIMGKKKELGNQIQKALDTNKEEFNLTPIRQEMERIKDQLHPVAQKDKRKEIDKIINMVNEVGEKGTLNDAFALQKALGEESKGAFVKNGALFMNDPNVARAAKAGYNEARKMVNNASPEIAKANNHYALLHTLEERGNKNLLATGKSTNNFLQAGSGENKVAENQLRQLGEASGVDALEKAQNISSADKFANPKFLPYGFNGKTATRLAIGGGAGAAIAGSLGLDPEKGALVGSAASSPAALKAMINLRNSFQTGAQKAAEKVAGAGANVGGFASKALSSGVPQSAAIQAGSHAGSKYADIMRRAHQRGPDSAKATNFILQQHPEYREYIKNHKAEEESNR